MTDATPLQADERDDLRGGPLLAAISNELVGLYRRYYGRGPTRARTVMVEDVVLCRLLDPFTTAERTLIDRGRLYEVSASRRAFQQELRGEFLEVVQRLTGQRVVAFLSDVHANPDMVVEMFFLEGAEQPGDPMAEVSRVDPEGRPGQ